MKKENNKNCYSSETNRISTAELEDVSFPNNTSVPRNFQEENKKMMENNDVFDLKDHSADWKQLAGTLNKLMLATSFMLTIGAVTITITLFLTNQ